jgi:hypothetical protein
VIKGRTVMVKGLSLDEVNKVSGRRKKVIRRMRRGERSESG